eukprot:gnl/MRDRNA2_/MRDRNA2_172312_c0_seq1.p1 gnl/MRDRNA2_/MRDRNA2_172312_c0~~gnl/MRDRNA2_/MRDRNA2_172312_c0_seq1.p1  ORF type:complete len:320 (-),score=49.16 gnl/MRDRNA2_/MRDRNA2_172312_c0_seq1:4-963(-)
MSVCSFLSCSSSRTTRRAAHAGSWYPDNETELRSQLSTFLASAEVARGSAPMKAIICPHAGYRYSGPTAAWAFANLQPRDIKRIFVLGPSHKVRFSTCALPAIGTDKYATPLGDISLDLNTIEELRGTGEFSDFSTAQDENEHSIEMQLPYTVAQMGGTEGWALIPIVVGSLSFEAKDRYGQILAPYFDAPDTVFIISSDFCHWGEKFRYFHYRKVPSPMAGPLPISAGIEALDRAGMELIQKQDAAGFQRYLDEEQNTICGRNAIGILLAILRRCATPCDVRFLHYSQSKALPASPAPGDSSVSYAAGLCCQSSYSPY